MALNTSWVVLIAAAVVLVAIVVGVALGLRSRAARNAAPAALVSRAERLRTLPAFRASVGRRMAALSGILALGVIATLLAGVVAARPMSAQTVQPVNTSRDIMLCLDVSGSMTEVDVEVLTVFDELLDSFEGERIGLTIFNSSPVQIFPLTDDYAFVREQLQRMRESFDYLDETPEHWVGTLNGPGASLIGDGLAACTMRFDHLDDERSRSVILATDNELAGASILTVEEAAQYARAQQVRVFALNPVQGKDAEVSAQLSQAAAITGGQSYALRDTTTVADIVAQIQKQEARALQGQAQVVWVDTPNLWMALMLVAILGFVVLLWVVRL
ncbi:VWA domain-containing protein [Microbacterium esteraromaticum]|uniref:VWA domain-containing protein n=1 Tax=Microbacterium esteraromaticum TaxID=57043 RepID=A0A939IUL3_9MICO|nr:VWA domain-containing protein [Microbacterium esteraromaticum]MBN8204758.1 VWA domain-containing protein [Microbacterium esteraromaticum]MBN8414912.1 VWA domain-containing protein [Microbacterium esteraromaticum]